MNTTPLCNRVSFQSLSRNTRTPQVIILHHTVRLVDMCLGVLLSGLKASLVARLKDDVSHGRSVGVADIGRRHTFWCTMLCTTSCTTSCKICTTSCTTSCCTTCITTCTTICTWSEAAPTAPRPAPPASPPAAPAPPAAVLVALGSGTGTRSASKIRSLQAN